MSAAQARLANELLRRPKAVIGSGTLGRRIALMLATRGGEVRIFGRDAERRRAAEQYVAHHVDEVVRRVPGGSAGRIVPTHDLAAAVADTGLVVESVPEQLAVKQAVFAELDRLAPGD